MGRIHFKVNGKQYSVGNEVGSSTTLLDYLRNHLELRGTKYMCLEGGCGACIVNVTKNPGGESEGINSCMVPITSCDNWDVTTIEGIGGRLKGYHPLQVTLAENNGSQCGYCSPGWVMAMYSILKHSKPTMLEVEQSFGSNICRCTGYRPILEAFKKFAKDAPSYRDVLDIEDLEICKKSGQPCSKNKCDESEWCFVFKEDATNEMLHILLNDGRDWYKPMSISDIFEVFNKKGTQSYMLLSGNTGKGVYPILEYPKVLINISGVTELKGHYIDQNLVIGGATTLNELMNIFNTVARTVNFEYLLILNDHLKLVAHVTIRNSATVAGNLMLKNLHPDFKSDIFLLLETVGAQLTIHTSKSDRKIVTMLEFLKEDMTGKIVLNILLPPLSAENKIVTFKIMPRSQNAHAFVHAGYLFKIDNCERVKECRIVIGGLSPSYMRSYKTESFLIGKKLFTNETLQGALKILNEDIVVTESLPDPPIEYKRQVALALFYKGLLSLCPRDKLNSRYLSGATKIHKTRPVSQGSQIFDANPEEWPLNKPMPKLEAVIQCAGESKYSDDLPTLPGEVYAAFVLTTVGVGNISNIDPSKALAEPGVIAFYKASDIPGKNSFIPAVDSINKADEELLCTGEVRYYNQPLGIIVAESQSILEKAASLVEVTYTNVKQPILDISVAKNLPERVSVYNSKDSSTKGDNIVKTIKGEQTFCTQYPFPLETLVGITHQTEEGLQLYPTTQWVDAVQIATSRALLIDENRIDVHVRRLGGAYGYKLSRSAPVSLASSLVSLKMGRPCRFVQTLTANIRSTGKRAPSSTNYTIAVSQNGVIQSLDYSLYSDNGCIVNEIILLAGVSIYNNVYKNGPWKYASYSVITDTPSNTFVRGPGSVEHIAVIETMIERIAYEMNLDSLNVRLSNLDTDKYGEIVGMVERIKTDSNYEERMVLVKKFNNENRWKKRGLKVSFLRFEASAPKYFHINMNVYKDDGTVAITHGGIEMGQGVNTIAAQICAYLLNIPVEKVQIKPTNTISTANNLGSDSSVTTQNVAIGVRRCCEELLIRLEPARKQLNNPSWVEIIQKAFSMNIDLQVHGFVSPADSLTYDIFGVAVAEVEIDVLTGEWEILRVDLIEDVGKSINPYIDIGQVEGAFIMGLGLWTMENIVYSPNGEIQTNRTWDYWVPGATDIPQDFRIYFRKRSFGKDVIFGAKTTGEPATCLAIVIPFAMRAAISSARLESGIPSTEWFQMDGAYTIDKISLATMTKIEDFKFY